MTVRRMARVVLRLVWVIVWLHDVWRKYYCLWHGSSHPCYRMDVRRMARVLLPVAPDVSSLFEYGSTMFRVSII